MRSLVLLTTLLAGCAEMIGPPPDDNPDSGLTGGDAGLRAKVTTTANADGSSTTIVDATSATAWTYADLATFTETDETGPWQLRFQRFHISTSTGTDVAPITGMAFDEVTVPPAEGWIADADTDGDGEINYAFDQGDGWYDYDVDAHVLTPKATVWVVRGSTTTIKLRINKYYDTAGTAAVFNVTWRTL